MSIYNIHAGHCPYPNGAYGAVGILNESNEDRAVKNEVIRLLKAEGHTVYDCTVDYSTTKSGCLSGIVSKCNAHKVDLDVSIHLNAGRNDYVGDGSTGGCEVYNYDTRTKAISDRINKNISETFGIRNRGTKYDKSLYVLANTNSLAILIECCFVDDKDDANRWDAKKCAKAIVEGILGKSISTNSNTNSSASTTSQLYRVRKSWNDAKSQIGAYASLDNAKRNCLEGYTVYDWNGNAVYSNVVTNTSNTNAQLYRVRLSWSDEKSQKGAYKVLDNAKSTCDTVSKDEKVAYSVFDEKGNSVYKSTVTVNEDKKEETTVTPPVEETTKDETSNVKPEAPTPVDISPLKGLDQDVLIAYLGKLAKEDMKKTGVLASVTIAQAILESGWGQSELSLKANNLFGMKTNLSGNTWASDWDGKIYAKWSPEEENGTVVSKYSDFRAYDTVQASIKDHSDYLCGAMNGSELRYKGLKGETDYRTAIQIIKDAGYATDSKYVDKVCSIIEQYDLHDWDDIHEDKTEDNTEKVPEEKPVVPDNSEKNNCNCSDDLKDIESKIDNVSSMIKLILDMITKIFEAFSNVFKK